MMDSSQSDQTEEQIVLAKLPAVVWKLVFESLETDFQTLEACSALTNYIRNLILKNGRVYLGHDKILPSVFRELIDKSDRKDDSPTSEPMLLLLALVELKPKITTFDIFIDENFRPKNQVLNSFLKLQSANLEIFHISCVGLESDPISLNLTESEMKNVRDLKILRSVIRIEEDFVGECRKSLYFNFPEHKIFPSLEKLTLSTGIYESWHDVFQSTNTDQGVVPNLKIEPAKVKYLVFLDFTNVNYGNLLSALLVALSALPNLVSLEMPAMPIKKSPFVELPKPTNLKRLTLTLPKKDRHMHVFDICITGYDERLCAGIFANPTQDPAEVRQEMADQLCPHEQAARRVDDMIANAFGPGIKDLINHLVGGILGPSNRDLNLYELLPGLEVVRIRSESDEWMPTFVSCPEFLNMSSLKVLDFCGRKPIHIPEEILQKMRERFTVLCG